MIRLPRRSCLPVVLLLAAACGDGFGSAAGSVVRDSAGIEIVESAAAAWAEDEGWSVAPEPALTIGVAEGDPNYQLYQVRNAQRLPDGRVVVLNSGTHEVRFYDSGGRFLSASGREGEGPGEFRALSSPLVPLPGDSLLVWDGSLGRATVLDAQGRSARTFVALPDGQHGAPVVGSFADGSLLADTDPPGGSIRNGYVWRAFVRLAPDGVPLDTIGEFRTVTCGGAESGECSFRPFGAGRAWAVAEDGLYYGFGDRYEIAVYSPDGVLRRLIRREHQPLPISGDDLDRFRSEVLGSVPDGIRPEAERWLASQDLPAAMPAFAGLLVDDEAHLWVHEHTEVRNLMPSFPQVPLRSTDRAPRWSVFGPDGRLLGSVATPPGLVVRQIGRDFVLGIHTDDLGVESVRLHPLARRSNR